MAILIGLRHGKALSKNDTGDSRADDLARKLSDEGIRQAHARRDALNGVGASRVLCSPATRAIETAWHVTGLSQDQFAVVAELYTPDDEDGQVLDELFETLGYATPADYLTADTSGAVERFAQNAGKALAAQLADLDDEDVVVIAGHAVFTPLAVIGLLELAHGPKWKHSGALYACNLPEAGVFKVELDGNRKVTAVEICD